MKAKDEMKIIKTLPQREKLTVLFEKVKELPELSAVEKLEIRARAAVASAFITRNDATKAEKEAHTTLLVESGKRKLAAGG